MKVYVAARFDQRERVHGVHRELREAGYEIAYDWTTHTAEENPASPAERDLEGVCACDVFILLAEEVMRGALVELGAALALGKRVYVVGSVPSNCIFYFHPKVLHRATVESVLKELY